MDTLLSILGASVVGLLGFVFYYKTGKDKAVALNQNLETKKEVLEIDKKIDKIENDVKSEEEKIEEVKKEVVDEKAKDVTVDNMLDFFNKRD